jgi:hypothetical protein
MVSIRKTCVAAAVAAGTLVVGVAPAHALSTAANPIINAGASLPLTPNTVGLNALGFNSTNYASIWSNAAALGLTPKLTDVRVFTKGTLAGSFTVTNTNTGAGIPVSSPALTFLENINGQNSGTLNTTNTTGTVPAAILRARQVSTTTPPGSPPISSNDPASSRYCPGDNWVAGVYDPVDQEQTWTCTTAQQASFNINPSASLTSTNWSIIGGDSIYGASSSFWSGNTVSIPSLIKLNFPGLVPSSETASFTLNGSGDDNYLVYQYDLVSDRVPAPLPLLGAGLAFGYSRRLRSRIKSSAALAS